MPFAVKYRRVDPGSGRSPETLAIDIDSREEAGALVDRLADSYPQNGRYRTPVRWFRNETGIHLIWVQPD